MARNTATATEEQIDKELVARTLGQVGERRSAHPDAPEMRFLNIASYSRYDNVHRALLIDSEDPEGKLRYGWTSDNRTDYKISDTGSEIVVESVDLELPDSDKPVNNPEGYVANWLKVLAREFRVDVANGSTQPMIDKIKFVGEKTLRLGDPDGRRATIEFRLEDD